MKATHISQKIIRLISQVFAQQLLTHASCITCSVTDNVCVLLQLTLKNVENILIHTIGLS